MASKAKIISFQTACSAVENRWMESLSKQLQDSSTGQRAWLRRMPLTKSFKADATVIAFITEANVPIYDRDHDFDRWRTVAHFAGMLIGTGTSGPDLPFVHAPDKRLGSVLGAIDYPEIRLLRLLSVRGEALNDQIRRVARVLAQEKKRQIDLCTLYHLLSEDIDESKAARIAIAHEYYVAMKAKP